MMTDRTCWRGLPRSPFEDQLYRIYGNSLRQSHALLSLCAVLRVEPSSVSHFSIFSDTHIITPRAPSEHVSCKHKTCSSRLPCVTLASRLRKTTRLTTGGLHSPQSLDVQSSATSFNTSVVNDNILWFMRSVLRPRASCPYHQADCELGIAFSPVLLMPAFMSEGSRSLLSDPECTTPVVFGRSNFLFGIATTFACCSLRAVLASL